MLAVVALSLRAVGKERLSVNHPKLKLKFCRRLHLSKKKKNIQVFLQLIAVCQADETWCCDTVKKKKSVSRGRRECQPSCAVIKTSRTQASLCASSAHRRSHTYPPSSRSSPSLPRVCVCPTAPQGGNLSCRPWWGSLSTHGGQRLRPVRAY